MQGFSNAELIIITEKHGAIKSLMLFSFIAHLFLVFSILEGPSDFFIWLGIVIVIFNLGFVYQLAKALKPA